MADLRISELPALPGVGLRDVDILPITDVSASTTKKITAKDLVQYGIALIDAGSIPADKFDIEVPPGSITTDELADGSVTAIKLADNSSGVVGAGLPATGTRIGQLAVDTDTDKLYVWTGTEWLEVKAAGSINSAAGDPTGLILVGVDQTGDEIIIRAQHADTTAARQFLAGPTAGPGPVEQREINGLDLPLADNATPGAVVVGGGLTIDPNGNLAIDNVVAEESRRSLATWNEYGLVTGGSPIESTDLPIASNSEIGAVIPGPSLTVDPASGFLDIANRVTPGDYAKVRVDTYGSVTTGLELLPEDLPDGIPLDKLEGEIGSDQLAECAVNAPNICDYATCLMQEDNPGAGDFLGQFWYTPSTAQLRVYSRGSGPENIWLPVGFGALQANNLRWGGTYNAETDQLVSLTSVAVAEGLTAGSPFPAPTNSLSGMYFICQTPGDNMTQPNLNGINHSSGDWALCLDENQGWIHIDTTGTGGGGGGAQYLNDLLDVDIDGVNSPFSTAPAIALANLQLLKYDGGSGQWRNTEEINGGTF